MLWCGVVWFGAVCVCVQIIIAPHGAGLSNMIYAAAGAVVVEIAFDQCETMCIDDMYV